MLITLMLLDELVLVMDEIPGRVDDELQEWQVILLL